MNGTAIKKTNNALFILEYRHFRNMIFGYFNKKEKSIDNKRKTIVSKTATTDNLYYKKHWTYYNSLAQLELAEIMLHNKSKANAIISVSDEFNIIPEGITRIPFQTQPTDFDKTRRLSATLYDSSYWKMLHRFHEYNAYTPVNSPSEKTM